ncbi:DUF2780 domain-containing protein [Permianibacter sp. IMCC34836]|uniref:DUF2780 domain-containing protein n=1 Tax=Permianibacter fluminis TaxID=2738515 RepID=UPI001558187A|nr:DUF2780 domain-containing protein [Permianibacter fluminis]NQD35839.1 DUF2780 domain-containing protein [Permianibacter fluminis]
MDLVQLLVSQLGVNAQQAQGGVGALLKVAKEQVTPATFGEIGKLLPQAADWMKVVPSSGGGLGGMLGGMLGGNLGTLAKIASQFQALGIDADQLAPFAKTAFEFLQKNLSGEAKDEISKLVSQFLK